MSDEDLVAALAEVLRGKQWVRKVMGDGHTSMLQADEFDLATAALPVVRRIAEQRAAAELLAALHVYETDRPSTTTWLRARAAALTATPNHGTDATT